MKDSDIRPHRARSLLALLALTWLPACQDSAPPDPKLGILTSSTDSLATAAEIRASLSGETAPGAEAYSFRGLYAGMPRARLERTILGTGVAADSAACQPSDKIPAELRCNYDSALGADHAPVHVSVLYTAAAKDGQRAAREIIVVRSLPLDVDGVRLAGALADAFERQTTLLDSRDATYGRHQAHIRMGTLNGARAHFAEVTVTSHSGREELTVRLGRGTGG